MCQKLLCLLPLLIFWALSFSQDSIPFGELTHLDKTFETYNKDPNASAVVLYEKGDVFFIVRDGKPLLIKKYHTKIKILDKKGFEYGDVSIPLLITKDAHEDVADIKAVTHNKAAKSYLQEEKIYPSNSEAGILEIKFAFPNVKVGSILEYKYTLLSPFFFKLDGWEFQSAIPKLYSEFHANIPLLYEYNRILVGEIELCTNEIKIDPDCFYAVGNTFTVGCESLRYAMETIPAFKYNEDYMLGVSNYISRLDFELAKIKGLNDGTKYTTSWEDVDNEFKTDKNIGKQLRHKGFFGRKTPNHLLKEKDEMVKATNIYNFIKNHYTWDGGYGIYGEAKVKEAFNKKKGNVAEINMSLINLLNSSGIQSNLLLTSTRQLGLPKKTYPVMSDFNYIIAKARINGKDYLLDATDKHIPFGMLPFHALNHYGRVMDFSDESYWHNIKAYAKNRYQVRARVEFDMESETAFGSMDVLSLGYNAIELRNLKDEKNEEEYLNILSTHFQNNLEVISYKQVQERSDEKKVSERIQFNVEILTSGDRIYFNPFLIQFFKQNPFLKEERDYPIDFGYPRHYKYQINVSIPEGYELLDLPKKDVIRLGDNMASLKYFNSQNEKAIMISFDFSVNSTYFEPTDYEVLRKLFSRIVEIQNNTLLALKKVKS